MFSAEKNNCQLYSMAQILANASHTLSVEFPTAGY